MNCCPKCEAYMLEYSTIGGEDINCYNPKCDYFVYINYEGYRALFCIADSQDRYPDYSKQFKLELK